MSLAFTRWMRRKRQNGYFYPKKPRYRPYKRINTRLRRLERGVTGKETKTHDLSVVSAGTITAGTVYYISNIAQGDRSIDRDGLKINVKSVWLKGIANMHASASNSWIRVIVFVDKACNGSLPATTGVGGLLEATGVLSFREHQNNYRFRILYDKMIPISSAGRTNTEFKFYRKFKKGLRVQYTDSSAAIGDAGNNSLFVMMLSNEPTNGPLVSARARLAYTD